MSLDTNQYSKFVFHEYFGGIKCTFTVGIPVFEGIINAYPQMKVLWDAFVLNMTRSFRASGAVRQKIASEAQQKEIGNIILIGWNSMLENNGYRNYLAEYVEVDVPNL